MKLEGAWGVLDAPGHFLRAGIPHRLIASQPVRMVFLDPTMVGRASSQGLPTALAALTALQADVLDHEMDRWLQGQALFDTDGASNRSAGDPRWAMALQWLEKALDGQVCAAYAAEAVGLSSSRFMHWFAERGDCCIAGPTQVKAAIPQPRSELTFMIRP